MPQETDASHATSTVWLNAPPVVEGRFAFMNGDFYAKTSGQYWHRRATSGELKELSENDIDRPAHWFEAQLIHYGLRLSKTKAEARERLYDAVNSSKLAVPALHASLEDRLRKKWMKNDREAKDYRRSSSTSELYKIIRTKRKINGDPNATFESDFSLPVTKKSNIATIEAGPSEVTSSGTKSSASTKATPGTPIYTNGCFTITCSEMAGNWPQYGSNYTLTFTDSDSSLWAAFNFGLVEGVMYFSDRPAQASRDPVPFKWRGRVAENGIMYGDQNQGWIKFLGYGEIEGHLEYQRIDFNGQRLPGPKSRSPINALTMQSKWNAYTEEEYERENRARWH
jgi:hypothetical protein